MTVNKKLKDKTNKAILKALIDSGMDEIVFIYRHPESKQLMVGQISKDEPKLNNLADYLTGYATIDGLPLVPDWDKMADEWEDKLPNLAAAFRSMKDNQN